MAMYCLPDYQINWLFRTGEEKQNSSHGNHQVSYRNDFSSFLSTSHPDASYQVWSQWPFGSGEEAKYRFSRWPSWISDQND